VTLIKKALGAVFLLAALFPGAPPTYAQRARGELRIEVRDEQGAGLACTGELVNEGNHVRRTFQMNVEGDYTSQDLPFGVYRLSVKARGFALWTDLVEIRSEVPVRVTLTLGLTPLKTQVEVNDSATLVDPYRTGTEYLLGRQMVGESVTVQPSRELSDAVDDLPGWLYEANGVLHPRGSEYDVQYIVDGLALTQNRSPSFAPALDAEDVEPMRVLTASYPAEYGRKLGGIIEVSTEKDMPRGLNGQFEARGGSFSTVDGSAKVSYAWASNRIAASAAGFHSGRYLDPPVLQNFTNQGNAGGLSASYERDFSDRDRLRVTFTHNALRFLVPNYLVQEEAGQRQDITNVETGGQFYFQHVISPDFLLSFCGSVRDTGAALSSNSLATPIIVSQNRGYREGYARGDLAGHHGPHDWKVGVDTMFSPVQEELQYTITDPSQFDPGTQQQFAFSDHRWDVESSFYLQDQIRLGRWNLSAGLRFDHYGFVVGENAWSPRIGVSRYVPSLDLLIHGSYDRIFQTPAMENLLLASSPQFDSINPSVLRLPVRPARGNYYEFGITKALRGKLRLDANLFRRDFCNYSDDDVLLDTGISFPIAFATARIIGEEIRLEAPHWGAFSGYVSYANQSGLGQGPVTGGLFLGSEVGNNLTDTSKFAVSQDQRNTVRARARFQATQRVWLAAGWQYGSGLPADVTSDPATLLEQYGQAIVDQVNLDRGRVKSNYSVDIAAGFEIYRRDQHRVSFQVQAVNLSNHVNVLNFASVFSGTAIAAPGSISSQLRLVF